MSLSGLFEGLADALLAAPWCQNDNTSRLGRIGASGRQQTTGAGEYADLFTVGSIRMAAFACTENIPFAMQPRRQPASIPGCFPYVGYLTVNAPPPVFSVNRG